MHVDSLIAMVCVDVGQKLSLRIIDTGYIHIVSLNKRIINVS